MLVSETQTSPVVLVVEDDQDTRRELRALLEDSGCTVIEARDGREALGRLVGATEVLPSLIVLDIQLPTMSGWELLSVMRSYVRLTTVPVVIVSGEPVQQSLGGRGVVAVLRKPVDGPALQRLVAAHSRSRH